jgi:hypothetical protein
MGVETELKWKYDGSRGLVIELPAALREKLSPTAQLAYGFKIEV